MSVQVLLVDDEEHMRTACLQAFELAGIPSCGFQSAELALTEIGRNWHGVVITDVKMAGMTGLELMARVRDVLHPILQKAERVGRLRVERSFSTLCLAKETLNRRPWSSLKQLRYDRGRTSWEMLQHPPSFALSQEGKRLPGSARACLEK